MHMLGEIAGDAAQVIAFAVLVAIYLARTVAKSKKGKR